MEAVYEYIRLATCQGKKETPICQAWDHKFLDLGLLLNFLRGDGFFICFPPLKDRANQTISFRLWKNFISGLRYGSLKIDSNLWCFTTLKNYFSTSWVAIDLGPFSRARADQTINSRLWNFWKSPFQAWDMVIWKWMLKICENLLTGTLFKQLPQAQIRSKFKNFCAHHEAKDKTIVLSTEKIQKSHLGTKLWVFEKKLWQNVIFF